MTSSKAFASVIAVKLAILADYALTLIPGWPQLPDVPKGALLFLVDGLIAYYVVYWAPANKFTIPIAPPVETEPVVAIAQTQTTLAVAGGGAAPQGGP